MVSCEGANYESIDVRRVFRTVLSDCNYVASIIILLAIGYILKTSGSFDEALIYVGVVGFLGAMSYLFIVDDVKRLELDNGVAEARA